ncbi:hypothetical protein SmJEL517_g06195 [Synchytrium microbalum]|uniref:C962R-like N-terminal AEP domain-containing protein n=1 Tax=Synchytrium microbalum TaxID=1806994 RepID=A0A507BWH0_9FUNG|nr:uncharacterized protein SmJEL517_g06195 [Synchytrium microbalum]TPX30184.1 hypothetical protein SmJEL517_g06195 [Synchytrium microbalum]
MSSLNNTPSSEPYNASFLIKYICEKGRETHTSLKGGVYRVSFEDHDAFLSDYWKAFRTKQGLYLMERISKGCKFRFFVDLDFGWTEDMSTRKDNEWRDFYKQLRDIASVVLNTRVMVSVRLCKIHIHCPDLAVSVQQAKSLLETLRKALMARLPELDTENIFDGLMYNSGLRMLGSCKPDRMNNDPDWVQARHKYYHPLDEDCEPLYLEAMEEEDALTLLKDISILILDAPREQIEASSSESTAELPCDQHIVCGQNPVAKGGNILPWIQEKLPPLSQPCQVVSEENGRWDWCSLNGRSDIARFSSDITGVIDSKASRCNQKPLCEDDQLEDIIKQVVIFD